MNRNPMVPANFVTLTQLKELKEKREEEERLRKLKEEEEEEKLRKLKEDLEKEEEKLRKLKEEEEKRRRKNETLRSKNCNWGQRRKGKPRQGSNPDAQVAGDGRSDLRTGTGADLEAQEAVNGRSDLGPPEASEESKKSRVKKMYKKKEKEGRLKGMPPDLHGFGVPTNESANEKVEEEKPTKVAADLNESEKIAPELRRTVKISGGGSYYYRPVGVIGCESDRVADMDKRVSNLKMGRRNPNANPKDPKVATDLDGSDKIAPELRRTVEKRVSDLKMSGRNPNPSPNVRGRGRGRGFGRGGRPSVSSGNGGGRGMVWVKKTTGS